MSDGSATFDLNPELRRLRFKAPGADTYTYLDPGMVASKEWISGELKDAHWHIHYKVPVNGAKSKSASIDVENLWTGGSRYSLSGSPTTH